MLVVQTVAYQINPFAGGKQLFLNLMPAQLVQTATVQVKPSSLHWQYKLAVQTAAFQVNPYTGGTSLCWCY